MHKSCTGPVKIVAKDGPGVIKGFADSFVSEMYGELTESNEEEWHARLGLVVLALDRFIARLQTENVLAVRAYAHRKEQYEDE